MIEPKDGEWWICTCEGYEQVLMLKGSIWVTTSCGKVGAYSTSIITPLYKMVKAGGTESLGSDYERGMREAMKDIAKSCGKTFSVDIGYLDLPKLVDELVNKDKPKSRTKVVYEKVESLLSCIDDHIEERLYNKVGDEFRKCVDCQKAVASTFLAGCLYRKVEKEIDWKDELAEKAGLVYDKASDSFDMNGKYWDSDWVKEFGHLVASLTDKPE